MWILVIFLLYLSHFFLIIRFDVALVLLFCSKVQNYKIDYSLIIFLAKLLPHRYLLFALSRNPGSAERAKICNISFYARICLVIVFSTCSPNSPPITTPTFAPYGLFQAVTKFRQFLILRFVCRNQYH